MISKHKIIWVLILMSQSLQASDMILPDKMIFPMYKQRMEGANAIPNPFRNRSLTEDCNIEIVEKTLFLEFLKKNIVGFSASAIPSQNFILIKGEPNPVKQGSVVSFENAEGASKGKIQLTLTKFEKENGNFAEFRFQDQTLIVSLSAASSIQVNKPFAYGMVVHPDGWVIATGLKVREIDKLKYQAYMNNILFECSLIQEFPDNGLALFKLCLPDKTKLPFIGFKKEPVQDGEKLDVQEYFGQQRPYKGTVWNTGKQNPIVRQDIGSLSVDSKNQLAFLTTSTGQVDSKIIQELFPKDIPEIQSNGTKNLTEINVLIYATSE